jgi:hypothetical protein
MARTALTPIAVTSRATVTAVAANDLDIAFEAADSADGNYWTPTDKDILLVHNPSGGALTFTIDAAPDGYGRDGAITTYSVGAGEFAMLPGLIKTACFQQTDGTVHINGSSDDLDFLVLSLP